MRNNIALVSQEIILFNTSVANNLSYGNDNANMDDIIHSTAVADSMGETIIEEKQGKRMVPFNELDKKLALDMMRQEMMKSAEHLDFERAAKLRDEIIQLEKELEKSFKE